MGVALSTDGSRLITSSSDKTAKIWDTATATVLHTLQGHSGWVVSADFRDDSSMVVTSGNDNTARMWDSASGQEIASFTPSGAKAVIVVAVSPDGGTLFTATDTGTLALWDVASRSERKQLKGHSGWLKAVQFSSDGRFLLTGSSDGIARLWNASSGRSIRSFEGHADAIRSLAFSTDAALILTGSDDQSARLWDLQTGEPLRTFERLGGKVECVGFVADDDNSCASQPSHLVAGVLTQKLKPLPVSEERQQCEERCAAEEASSSAHPKDMHIFDVS
mmetsp:Transcript_36744/g.67365  ORF Transcript_36744/g.67365 Transcript_36744/m.67365 type:complete len:277 (+) Transcript_36744:3-833(+)